MSDRDIIEAEGISRTRALCHYVMAALLLAMGFISARAPKTPDGATAWGLIAITLMIMLTGVARGGVFHRPAVRRLLEDESTREHRRTAQVVGFWAAMASGLAMLVVGYSIALPVEMGVRIVLTASLCAAQIAFATLELLATRDD